MTRLDENRQENKKRGKNILEIINVLHLVIRIFRCCWCCFLFCCAVSFLYVQRCHLLVWWWKTSTTTPSLPLLFPRSFFPILSFLFRLLFLDAHLVVTEFVNKLIHRILRHAHLSIIRNDHSINTTLATNQPSIINANRFLCDEGLFLNFKLHVPSLTSTTAEILMS